MPIPIAELTEIRHGSSKQVIMQVFEANPNMAFNVTEIVKHTQLSRNTVYRQLLLLVTDKTLTKQRARKYMYFFLNNNSTDLK